MPKSNDGTIQLVRLNRVPVNIWIIGTAPLIHKWSEKALKQMRESTGVSGGPRTKKGIRDPEEEAESAVYKFRENEPIASGNIGFPASGFKSAVAGGCRFFDNLTLVETKQLIFIEGEIVDSDQLVHIFYRGEPKFREDAVRIQGGSNDLRYRYQFFPWWACLTIQFTPTSISLDSIAALVDAGGLGGVGEWRPSAPKSLSGTFGTFRLMTDEEKDEYEVE